MPPPPLSTQVSKRMQEVCGKEGLRINDVGAALPGGEGGAEGCASATRVPPYQDEGMLCLRPCEYRVCFFVVHHHPASGAPFIDVHQCTPHPSLQATMNALVDGAGGDLRLILGQLQMVRRSRTTLSYDEVKGGKQVRGGGEGACRTAQDCDKLGGSE